MNPEEIDVTKLSEEGKTALLALLEGVETSTNPLRLSQLRNFKENNLFWHGFQYIFWSEADNDWRIPTREELTGSGAREETQYIFDYVVNKFKAHGESIIAALSADIPSVRFGPRDAMDPTDHRAVAAADNAVGLIERWNRAKLLIIQALFYLATEGFVASYTYNRKDPTYGSVKIPKYGRKKQMGPPDTHVCDTCGYSEPIDVGGDFVQPTNELSAPDETQQTDPNADPVAPPEEFAAPVGPVAPPPPQSDENQKPCPQCGEAMDQEGGIEEEVPFLTGNTMIAKGREIVEIYGAMSVNVPGSVAKQADAGHCIHYVDADPAAFKEAYDAFADQIDNSDDDQTYERQMRQSSLIQNEFNTIVDLTTEKRCWFRPWMLRRLTDTHDVGVKEIRKMCPDGIYVSVIGKVICALRNESMDKHWTFTKAGPSKGLHADPLLQSLVPLQKIENNLMNQVVMQVEYGVAETYADTEVFDFEGQSKQEVSPGFIYPVTPRPGQSIADSFYTGKTSTLSKETSSLFGIVNEAEQFVSGSFPSIFGGPAQGGSKTLGEYEKSRSFALQRLSLVWYYINVWYGETMHKALLSFVDHQVEDEPVTSESSKGSWQTAWIRKADLKGSFDRIEPEASSDFPISFGQKRSILRDLLQLGSDEINSVLFSSDNAGFVASLIGLSELKIPSAQQRNKQMREILQMIGFAPNEMKPDMMQPSQIISTVPVEPLIDDHEVHIEVCIEFLSSDTGQDMKEADPQSYANILAHIVEHKQAMIASMPPPVPALGAPAPGKPPGGPPVQAPKPNGKAAPQGAPQ